MLPIKKANSGRNFFDFHVKSGLWFLLGLFIFVAGLYTQSMDVVDINISRAIWCVGLVIVIYVLGDSIQLLSSRFNFTGAVGLGLAIFATNVIVPPTKVHGELVVNASNDEESYQMNEEGNAKRPSRVAILLAGVEPIEGVRIPNRYINVFGFEITESRAKELQNDGCPTLIIEFPKVAPIRKPFLNANNVMSFDNRPYFRISYKADKDELTFLAKEKSYPLDSCGTAKAKAVLSQKEVMNGETAVDKPLVTQPISNASNGSKEVLQKQEKGFSPSANNATRSGGRVDQEQTDVVDKKNDDTDSSENLHSNNKILGYVVFAELNPESGSLEKVNFDLEGSVRARAPAPNQKIILKEPVAVLRMEPFHWDTKSQSHTAANPVASMVQGQTAVVAGDSIIAQDESNDNKFYIITPIASVIGEKLENKAELYPNTDLYSDTKGFVYLGYFDGSNPNLSDKSFDNYSSPNSIYPSPGDILVARSDIFLRKGPRRWNPVSQTYFKPETVSTIRKGEYVKVAGDIILSARGVASWAPISKQAPFTHETQGRPGLVDRMSHSVKEFFKN